MLDQAIEKTISDYENDKKQNRSILDAKYVDLNKYIRPTSGSNRSSIKIPNEFARKQNYQEMMKKSSMNLKKHNKKFN